MARLRQLLPLAHAFILGFSGTARHDDDECLLQTRATPQDVPLVSVIMPVHNTLDFLNDSTGTVMNQTLGSWELVLVDVASSDGSLQLENSIASQHPQVKLLRVESQPLGGAGIPSNIGMEAATGKYIAFLDPDDRFDVTFLEKMVKAAEASEADVVVCGAAEFNASTVLELDPRYWQQIPKDVPLSLQATPEDFAKVILLNAGPWRKLYLRRFLEQTGTRWTEGDFFFEDNRFHWSTLLNAKQVVVKNDTLVFHRFGRTGQTGSVAGSLGFRTARWATLMMHYQAVGAELSQRPNLPPALWSAFFMKIGQNFRVAQMRAPAIPEKLGAETPGKYGAKLNSTVNMLFQRFQPVSPLSEPEALDAVAGTPSVVKLIQRSVFFGNHAESGIDLSIVVPVHKVPLDLEQQMQDMFKHLKLGFEVFFVYDRIDNDSIELLQKQDDAYDNVFAFESMAPNAGRARNTAYPLLRGDFTFFFDVDDSLDFEALAQAVREAQSQGSEVMLLRYNISTPRPEASGQTATKGMMPRDTAIWSSTMDHAHIDAKQDQAAVQQLSKILAAGLTAYPWKQLTRTRLLQDKSVFFGPSSVHNDVQFHWHSLAVANRIDFSKGRPVCTHFKSGIAGVSLTEERSESRLEVFDALKWTYRVLNQVGFLGLSMQNNSLTALQVDSQNLWVRFVKELVRWNEYRIPSELLAKFKGRREQLFLSMGIADDDYESA